MSGHASFKNLNTSSSLSLTEFIFHDATASDFNVAPLPDDVWSHKALFNVVSHTKLESDLLSEIKKSGDWIDTFREMKPSGKLYSWWSYRARDWKISNRGRRLDHIWASQDLKSKLSKVQIFSEARDWERPSDHVPILSIF